MTRKYILSLAAATIGSGLIAVTGAYAFGFGGHHGHHGSGAAKACIAVMNHDQRDGLKTIFKGEKGTFFTDHKAAETAKQDLALAILNKGDVSTAENNLSAAKLKVLQDQDAVAAKICGQLNAQQLSAAQNLYKNMTALRQSSHEQARTIFQNARTAAGNPSPAVQGNTPAAE
jgi:hypothetical protein